MPHTLTVWSTCLLYTSPLPGRHLAQLLVGLGRGDAHPVDGPQAKGVVPVPVGQHGEVRQGQALLLQGPVELCLLYTSLLF